MKTPIRAALAAAIICFSAGALLMDEFLSWMGTQGLLKEKAAQ